MWQPWQVRLINTDKEMIGIVTREEALRMADELQVDVICISPDADPPVCRLLEYSKYRYELEKASKEAKKKQKAGQYVEHTVIAPSLHNTPSCSVDIKELKMRPNTDVHDYQVRLRAAEKFIAKGNKVKLSLQFRGREMEFRDIGKELMEVWGGLWDHQELMLSACAMHRSLSTTWVKRRRSSRGPR